MEYLVIELCSDFPIDVCDVRVLVERIEKRGIIHSPETISVSKIDCCSKYIIKISAPESRFSAIKRNIFANIPFPKNFKNVRFVIYNELTPLHYE